jgi:hypothetical protein
MAARTSASTGTLVTISILSLTTLGLFVLSVVFFAQRRGALDKAQAAEETTKLVISDRDRNDPVVQKLQADAQNHKPQATQEPAPSSPFPTPRPTLPCPR